MCQPHQEGTKEEERREKKWTASSCLWNGLMLSLARGRGMDFSFEESAKTWMNKILSL